MRRTLVALVLAMTLPLPVLAGQVTVRDGETLSEIAERHGISLTRLMQINGIRDADLVEAGRTLRLPGGGGSSSGTANRSGGATVTVKPGETLSEIAERHGISLTRLMQINGIRDADLVEAGQTLRLQGPGRTTTATSGTPSYPRNASVHVVRAGESLSVIASGYGISLSKLIAINGIGDPDLVEAGTRLKLKGTPAAAPSPRPAVSTAAASSAAARPAVTATVTASPASAAPAPARRPAPAAAPVATPAANPVATPRPAPVAVAAAPTPATTALGRPDWRTYGPLQVNWSAWQPLGGSMVVPTLNGEGQTLYLAVNCGARKVNATSTNGEWQTWNDPTAEHEQQLVNDYCRANS